MQRLFSRQAEPLPLLDADFVCDALRIVTEVDTGYAQVLRRSLDWADRWEHDLPPLEVVATIRRYPDKFDNYAWLERPKRIRREVLNRIPEIFMALRAAKPNVRLAGRRLSLAALRDEDDDRTIDACIGLEALLGEGRDELSHRLALRAATALGTRPTNAYDAQTTYDVMRKVYSHRSAVVHGTNGDKSRTITLKQEFATADIAVSLLRELLTDALTRPGGWTAKSLDSTLLAALKPLSSTGEKLANDTNDPPSALP
jgi:hypothetical protein